MRPTALRRSDPVTLLIAGVAAAGVALIGSNTVPLVVGAMIDGLGVGPQAAGLLAGVEIGGVAVGALLLAPLMATRSRRAVALCGAAIVLGAELASVRAPYPALLLPRALAGFGQGLVLAALNAALARSVDPDRLYARVAVIGGLLAAILLSLLPIPIERFAHVGAFVSLAALVACSLPFLLWLPRAPASVSSIDVPGRAGRARRFVLALLAGVLLQAVGQGSVWAFSERIGASIGMAGESIGRVLGVATLIGILGAGAAERLGTRFGRARPLLAALGLTATSALGIALAPNAAAFAAGQVGLAIAFLFGLPYLMGTAAGLDPGGRVAAAVGGASTVGNALGPTLAGPLVALVSLQALGWLAVACVAAAAALLVPVARALDQR